MPKLFFNRKLRRYYLYPTELEPIRCNSCRNVFEENDSLIYHRRWHRDHAERLLICDRCFCRVIPALVDEYLVVRLCNIIPKDSILVSDERILLQPSSRLSVFEASELISVETRDDCKLSGRESWLGVKIGAEIADEPVGSVSVSLDDGIKYLRMLCIAKPEPSNKLLAQSHIIKCYDLQQKMCNNAIDRR